ncbi:unnamed protein product [Linum trigynum]|uniref:Fe2OG dioxygenase domain-containing protein n=1 Tax=Linum trigynum TaxID=586398 RepID=A0AAV2D631_9ROSI
MARITSSTSSDEDGPSVGIPVVDLSPFFAFNTGTGISWLLAGISRQRRRKTAHQDGNSLTFVIQDDAGGLEVCKNGEWIPATPTPGAIIVNVGETIQVLTNDKLKSAMHRVTRPKGRSRYSYSFFYSVSPEKWVEPLPEFTEQLGELPKYRKFQFGEYLQLIKKDVTNPPQRPEDALRVAHYSIE